MTPEEIRALSLIDVRDKIAAGELTSVEVTEATLEQAERFGQSHALFTTYAPEMAREMAKAADEARDDEQHRQDAGGNQQPDRQQRLDGERPAHWPSLSSSAGTWTWSAL